MIPLEGEEYCNLQADAEQYNAEKCNIERECIKLEKNQLKIERQKKNGMKDANKQFNYLIKDRISRYCENSRCKVSSLYRELKKRGVLEMPKQAAPSKTLRSPIIKAKTKKSRFERYKEYYMYK